MIPVGLTRDVADCALRAAVELGCPVTIDARSMFDADDLSRGLIQAAHGREMDAVLMVEMWLRDGEGHICAILSCQGEPLVCVRVCAAEGGLP